MFDTTTAPLPTVASDRDACGRDDWDRDACDRDWEAEDRLIDELLASGSLEPDDAPPMLPPDIADWEPDLRLAAVLSVIDVDELSEEDRVRYLRASDRLNNAGQARSFRAMASISDAYNDLGVDMADAERGAALEIRAALRLTPRTAENELALAHEVRSRIPALMREMMLGRIDPPSRQGADQPHRASLHRTRPHGV